MSEIGVSHLSILRLLAVLTNRRNQNAPPVERISSTTAFAPLNNGSTVVIISRKKSRGLGREVLMRFAREVIPAESMERRFAILYRSATLASRRKCRLGSATSYLLPRFWVVSGT